MWWFVFSAVQPQHLLLHVKAIHERPYLKPLSTTSGYSEHWLLKPLLHVSVKATHGPSQPPRGFLQAAMMLHLSFLSDSLLKFVVCVAMVACNNQRRKLPPTRARRSFYDGDTWRTKRTDAVPSPVIILSCHVGAFQPEQTPASWCIRTTCS